MFVCDLDGVDCRRRFVDVPVGCVSSIVLDSRDQTVYWTDSRLGLLSLTSLNRKYTERIRSVILVYYCLPPPLPSHTPKYPTYGVNLFELDSRHDSRGKRFKMETTRARGFHSSSKVGWVPLLPPFWLPHVRLSPELEKNGTRSSKRLPH